MSTPHDIDPRDARIAQLEAENALLRARIEQLERLLGIDSQNSSKPPSSDSEAARHKRQKKRSRKRSPGGQPGHPGAKRELLPPEQVDFFHDHFPEHCACGLELGPQDDTGEPLRHQHFELVPKLVHCTEHRLHARCCAACGTTTRATLTPVERLGWGPRLTALLATLSVTLHATRGKLAWFLTHVLGAPSSKGSVQTFLEEASAALAPAHAQARAAVQSAEYIGCDETGWRLERLPHWLWLVQCSQAVFVALREGRTKACAMELLEGAQARVITTDRYGAYHWLSAERNQVCRAHLLRDWTSLAQREGALGKHGKRLEKLERKLHREWRR